MRAREAALNMGPVLFDPGGWAASLREWRENLDQQVQTFSEISDAVPEPSAWHTVTCKLLEPGINDGYVTIVSI